MDHLFQIRSMGQVDEEMLESFTTLGFLAASTQRIDLGTLVTRRQLSPPGRAHQAGHHARRAVRWAGCGWASARAGTSARRRGLGCRFRAMQERFERLEDTLARASDVAGRSIRRSMASARCWPSRSAFAQPSPAAPAHPDRRRRRAQDAAPGRAVRATRATSSRGSRSDELERKLEILRAHCEAEGRNYDEIEKTVLTDLNPRRKIARADRG